MLRVVTESKKPSEIKLDDDDTVVVIIQLSLPFGFNRTDIEGFLTEMNENPGGFLTESPGEGNGDLVIGINVLERMALLKLVQRIQEDKNRNDFVCDPLYAQGLQFEKTTLRKVRAPEEGLDWWIE
jgi:hypothetical protein